MAWTVDELPVEASVAVVVVAGRPLTLPRSMSSLRLGFSRADRTSLLPKGRPGIYNSTRGLFTRDTPSSLLLVRD